MRICPPYHAGSCAKITSLHTNPHTQNHKNVPLVKQERCWNFSASVHADRDGCSTSSRSVSSSLGVCSSSFSDLATTTLTKKCLVCEALRVCCSPTNHVPARGVGTRWGETWDNLAETPHGWCSCPEGHRTIAQVTRERWFYADEAGLHLVLVVYNFGQGQKHDLRDHHGNHNTP